MSANQEFRFLLLARSNLSICNSTLKCQNRSNDKIAKKTEKAQRLSHNLNVLVSYSTNPSVQDDTINCVGHLIHHNKQAYCTTPGPGQICLQILMVHTFLGDATNKLITLDYVQPQLFLLICRKKIYNGQTQLHMTVAYCMARNVFGNLLPCR